MGVVTFETLLKDVHNAIKTVDELMDTVKNRNKDSIAHKIL